MDHRLLTTDQGTTAENQKAENRKQKAEIGRTKAETLTRLRVASADARSYGGQVGAARSGNVRGHVQEAGLEGRSSVKWRLD